MAHGRSDTYPPTRARKIILDPNPKMCNTYGDRKHQRKGEKPMSAYVVGKDHIDLMVSMAVRGTGPDHGLRVFHEGEVRHFDLTTADEVGQILHNENVHSVNYRYNEQTEPETYVFQGYGIGSNLGGALIPWGHVLQAIRCYEYQSCEDTQRWGGSLANEICRALRLKVCGIIADQSDAPWEWSRDEMELSRKAIKEALFGGVRS